MNRQASITGLYRHYKGNEYRVIGEAKHSETEERLVIYETTHGPYIIWARPYDMFFDTVVVDAVDIPRLSSLDT